MISVARWRHSVVVLRAMSLVWLVLGCTETGGPLQAAASRAFDPE